MSSSAREGAHTRSPEPGDLYTPQVNPLPQLPPDEEDPPYPELDRLPITFTAVNARSTFFEPHSEHSRPSPEEYADIERRTSKDAPQSWQTKS